MGVESGERLVEQQHAGIARQRPSEGDPLALTARKLRRPGLRKMRDPEPLEVLVDPRGSRIGDVLADVHVREERVLLEDEADAALVRLPEDAGGRVEPDVAVECDASRSRPDEPRDRSEDRGLARSGRPDKRDRSLDLERDL